MNETPVDFVKDTLSIGFVSVDQQHDKIGTFQNSVKELKHQIDVIQNNFGTLSTRAWLENPKNGKWHISFGTGNHGKIDEFNNFLKVNTQLAGITTGILTFGVLEGDAYAEQDETGQTFLDNCFIKSRGLSSMFQNENKYILAEDSGICVDILNGRPGVHSARVQDDILYEGVYDRISRQFPELDRFLTRKATEEKSLSKFRKNMKDFVNKVIISEAIREKLSGSIGFSDPFFKRYMATGNFVTTASIAKNGEIMHHAVGHMYGRLFVPTTQQYGDDSFLETLWRDFGYNSIFAIYDREMHREVPLSMVSGEDRLKWNHRSIAMARVIVGFLFQKLLDAQEEKI
jgi:inosine/xanthosine triphosphate pyrophosphatase family protein